MTNYNFDNQEAASEQPQGNGAFFGKVALSTYQMMRIAKGQPKVAWTSQFPVDQAYAEYQLTCHFYKKDGAVWEFKLKDLEFGSKWKVTYRSLKALGVVKRIDVKGLEGAYVHAKLVPTGRKYTVEDVDGEMVEREERTLSFVALYDNEAECKAARDAHYGVIEADNAVAGDDDNDTDDNEPQVDTAELLKALWKASSGNERAFKALLKSNPQLGAITPDVAILIGKGETLDADLPF